MKEIVKKNVVFGHAPGNRISTDRLTGRQRRNCRPGEIPGWLVSGAELILHIADFVLSFAITTVLFVAMCRFLSNTKVEWRDVWVGAAVTSFLFYLGKMGLGLYLCKGAVGSSYRAAGSILVLLLWVYYSGLIFYFGVEFTVLDNR